MGMLDWLGRLLGDEWTGAVAAGSATVTEGVMPFAGLTDPDAGHTGAQIGSAYSRRLTATSRDLNPVTDERAREIAYGLWSVNPLARQVLRVVRDYIMGEGVAVQATGEDEGRRQAVQTVIDAFWRDRDNDLDMKLPGKVLELALWGEACWPVGVTPANGRVELAVIVPSEIKQIVVDPRNVTRAVAVVVKDGGGADDIVYKVIDLDRDPASASYGRLVGLRTDKDGAVIDTYRAGDVTKPYAGACFLYRINKVETATRGRSDLLPLADWIDSIDQILMNEVDRADLIKSFVWDVTHDGASEQQIADWLAKNPAPKPGSIRAHNEKVTWQAVSPELHSYEVQQAVDLLIGYVATGAGIPKTWLSSTDDVNRATAADLSEPAFKALTLRQREVKAIVTDLITFALDQAELAGRLPTRPAAEGGTLPEPWAFTVVMPELRPRDLKMGADTLASAVNGLVTARADGLVDRETGQQAMALLLAQMGVDVKLEDMQARIAAEDAEREAERAAMMDQMQGDDGNDSNDGDDSNDGNDTRGRPVAMVAGGKR